MMAVTTATARESPWVERRRGVFGEVHVRKAPVGVVGAIVPWNVPHLVLMPKLDPGADRRLHGRRQAGTGNTVGRHVVGRNAR